MCVHPCPRDPTPKLHPNCSLDVFDRYSSLDVWLDTSESQDVVQEHYYRRGDSLLHLNFTEDQVDAVETLHEEDIEQWRWYMRNYDVKNAYAKVLYVDSYQSY